MKRLYVLLLFATTLSAINPPPAYAAMDPVEYVLSKGIMMNEEDGAFHPDKVVTRSDVVKAMVDHMYSEPSEIFCYAMLSPSSYWLLFEDVPIDADYGPELCMAMRTGVIDGDPGGTFRPNDALNYAEASKIITKYHQVVKYDSVSNPWYDTYVKAMLDHGALPPGAESNLAGSVTKGDLAYMLHKIGAGY